MKQEILEMVEVISKSTKQKDFETSFIAAMEIIRLVYNTVELAKDPSTAFEAFDEFIEFSDAVNPLLEQVIRDVQQETLH